MQYTDRTFQAYLENHTETAPPLLTKIEQDTRTQVRMPQMLAGHLQGRVLAAFSYMIRPARILEIGTYMGYSALCLAEGLQKQGILHTIDNNQALETVVKSYFEQAGITHKIRYHIGTAVDIIPQLDEVFDLVFIDADKKNYSHYYDLVFDRVRSGGFIIADNVLWRGKVLAAASQSVDKRAQAISHFNVKVHHDSRVANVLLPIRDGLMILRKK